MYLICVLMCFELFISVQWHACRNTNDMGKADFPDIYVGALNALGRRPTLKLSTYCSTYRKGSNYAGMIIYHTYGHYSWKQRANQGVAGGYRGR